MDINLVGAAPAVREAIVSKGDLVPAANSGWGCFVMASNRIRMQARSATSGEITYYEYTITRGVDFKFSGYLDRGTNTVYAEIDGIEVSPVNTANSINDLTDDFNLTEHDIGGQSTGTTYFATVDIKDVMLSSNLSDFDKIKAAL